MKPVVVGFSLRRARLKQRGCLFKAPRFTEDLIGNWESSQRWFFFQQNLGFKMKTYVGVVTNTK